MKRYTPLLTLTALTVSTTILSTLTPVQAAEPTTTEQVVSQMEADPTLTVAEQTDRLVVTLTDEATDKQALAQEVETLTEPLTDTELVKDMVAADDSTIVIESSTPLDATEQDQVIADLEADPRIEEVVPDKLVRGISAAATSEPAYPRLFALQPNYLNVAGAWSQGYTGVGQIISIVDTGTSAHPDLKAPVSSYDFVSDPYLSRDGNGRDADARDMGNSNANANWHGTFIQGQINARHNGQGTIGVAHGADVTVARALGHLGIGYASDMADAIIWSAGGPVAGVPKNPKPATVINGSFAWPSATCDPFLAKAINYALSKEIPVVVAAGNSGVNANGITPANCYRAIVVGATTSWNTLTAYSNWGPMLDVVAPGGTTGSDIYSTTNTGFSSIGTATYGNKNGTSMSAPYVAGTIALMKQANPALTVEQIRSMLTSTGKNVAGYKQVNASAAVKAAAASKPKPAPTSTGYRLAPGSGIEGAYWRYGGPTSFGNPTSHEIPTLNGVYQNFSKNQTFYWTEATGAQPVNFSGGIGAKFAAGGYERTYGFPLFPETAIPHGAMQKFRSPQGVTAFYWTPAHHRTHTVWEGGAIGSLFTQHGGTLTYGFPTTDEKTLAHGAWQNFTSTRSSTDFYWAPNTGVHRVNAYGAIKAAWAGKVTTHGFPATDEVPAYGGGVTQLFRTASGGQYIYLWSERTGAHWMNDRGAIAHHFRTTGAFRTYGYPTTDETYRGNGTYSVTFSSGKTITWNNATGIRVR